MARRPQAALTVVMLVVSAMAAVASPAGARTSPVVRPTQELATLLTSHEVFAEFESVSAERSVRAWRPITGEQTVLPVIGRGMRGGLEWLRVRIPGRPNGTKGWISQTHTRRTGTSWHLVVRRSARQVDVYDHGRFVRRFSAIVGKPSTPTPLGRFFVEESVRLSPHSPGAPFALALSARSDALLRFEGGSGQIAIHGMENLEGAIGTASSHGCVRLAERSIRWLAVRIPPGTPVTVIP